MEENRSVYRKSVVRRTERFGGTIIEIVTFLGSDYTTHVNDDSWTTTRERVHTLHAPECW